MENTRIAVLSIIVEDSESTAKLNEMIHDYAEYVVGRMGIPYREKYQYYQFSNRCSADKDQ